MDGVARDLDIADAGRLNRRAGIGDELIVENTQPVARRDADAIVFNPVEAHQTAEAGDAGLIVTDQIDVGRNDAADGAAAGNADDVGENVLPDDLSIGQDHAGSVLEDVV